ncbi:PQQ-binding-like beta-propeller repeat protein [Bacteroidota bacterium]
MVICDPQIGAENSEQLLISAIKNVNSRADIDLLVILGNLTHSGSYDEFLILELILSNQKIPFRIIGGPNDILLSETRSEEIMQIWPDAQNTIHSSSSDKIFLQTIPYWNSNKAHISVEKLNQYSSSNSGNENIFIFTYNSFWNDVDNSYKLSNIFERKNFINFISVETRRRDDEMNSSEIKLSLLNENNKWCYNLLKESNETLGIYKISEKRRQSELKKSIPISEFTGTEIIDSLQMITYLPEIKINKLTDNQFTSFTPILYSNKRIFIASKNGRIICLNDSGEKIWEYSSGGLIFNSILKDRDLIIAITQEGDIHTVNVNNGDPFQIIGIGDYISSDINLIDIEYNDMKTKGIVFGSSSGNIYCYELYSLEMVWSNYISENSITSKSLALDDKIIFQDSKGDYYCVNLNNGLLIWRCEAKSKSENKLFRSDYSADKNSVYFSDSDGNISSVDILLGTKNWIKKGVKSSGSMFLSKLRSSLFVHSMKNRILEIEPIKGKIISEIELPDEFSNNLTSAWLEYEHGILAGFDNGSICRIDKNNKIEKIFFMGNAPIISINMIGVGDFIANNIDGTIIRFTVP